MSWSKDAFFYHIYPLGFCGAPACNDYNAPVSFRLCKIKNWLEHMLELGVNAIYFGPLFESVSHGYDTVNYYKIDRRLGDDATFREVVQLLHNQGIKVVIDGVFNHVGRDFWAFRDLLTNGRQSRYTNWFQNINFNDVSPYGDPFSYEGWEGHYNLVKLNLCNPEVKEHIFSAVRKWISYYDIDGLRLDVAYCLDCDFIKALARMCRSLKVDFWLMGEAIHGDYNQWVNAEMLDAVTNYECYKGLYSSHNDKNYFEIAYSLNRQFGEEYGIYQDMLLYNFVDNHDVTRIASTVQYPGYLYPLHALLFTMPGIPSIYYGSEWGIEGQKAPGSDAVLRPALVLSEVRRDSVNKDLVTAVIRFAAIRHKYQALRQGRYRQVFVKSQQYAFLRVSKAEAILVMVNSACDNVAVEFNLPLQGHILEDVLNEGESFAIHSQKVCVTIPSCWARICIVK